VHEKRDPCTEHASAARGRREATIEEVLFYGDIVITERFIYL